MPAGFDVTVPSPVFPTVSVRTPWKVAVTVFAASMATEQVKVPVTEQFERLFHPRRDDALEQGARSDHRPGAGIVADSDPDREWEESRVKLRAVGSALGGLEGGG